MQLLIIHILSSILMLVPTHKYYVSITDMEWNDSISCIQISSRIFTDDLETALGGASSHKIDLSDSQNPTNDSLLSVYILSNIQILAPSARLPLHWVGYEVDAESVWCYLESDPLAEKPAHIKVSFSILMSTFSEQQNVINFIQNNQIRSFIFESSNFTYQIPIN